MVNQRKKLISETQLWLTSVEKLVAEVGSFPDTGRILPTTGLVGHTTPHRVAKVIWELLALADMNTSKIGVYGMGSVGKTSIMMHIYNQLIDCKIFDKVIWVNVSKSFDIDKMQLDIANATNLELSKRKCGMEIDKAIEHLHGKKFVLILDDMWHKFSLEEVGIPPPSIDNGCKFVFVAHLMEDQKIDAAELIKYWMAEELITEVGDREKEINKGYTVLEKLKDACLLEDIGSDYVKMHD
ncbi:hypothetical protein L6452_01792 [Arctium lappa]|uniref:Uncharacterized protein n=1 Tax=Arctium lappa TaxID=4217 RepID=A0ACB9FIY6_ARCLA|nr:hypothetical protein L6452_01792 [Arctium lappa]